MPDSKELRQKLKDASQEVRNLSVIAMRPGHSQEKLETLKQLERSARAEVSLRKKALDHQLAVEKQKPGR